MIRPSSYEVTHHGNLFCERKLYINAQQPKLLSWSPTAWSKLIFHKIRFFEFQYQPLDGRRLNKTNIKRCKILAI